MEQWPVRDGEIRRLAFPDNIHARRPDILISGDEDSMLDICMTFDIPCNAENNVALRLLNMIIGGTRRSRLQKRIRDTLQYSVDIFSSIERYCQYEFFCISFSVSNSKFLLCLREILQILEDSKSGISEQDISRTFPFILLDEERNKDDPLEMNFQLFYQHYLLKKDLLIHDEEDPVILRNTIQKQAAGIFVPENCCISIVGDTDNIRKDSIRNIIHSFLS